MALWQSETVERYEFARPAAFDEVARSLPELRLVIGNFGHAWSSETIALIAKHPHVYTDVAGIVGRPWDLYNALLTAVSCDVMDKVLFDRPEVVLFPIKEAAK